MFHQIVEIREEKRYISLYRGFLVIKADNKELGRVPLDDIAVLLISAQGAFLTKNILVELAERGAITIFCGKNYAPQSIVYPLTYHYKLSGILKYQINEKLPLKKQCWKQITQIKLQNQAKSLRLCAKNTQAEKLEYIATTVKSGDPENREGYGARVYWSALFGESFVRDQNGKDINALLNYGYAVIRSAMARALCSAGLNLSLGVHHDNALNPFCLADDFLEIYRPLVDVIVFLIQKDKSKDIELTHNLKTKLIKVIWIKMKTTEGSSPVFQSMQYMATSYVKALQNKECHFEIPLWEGKYDEFSSIEQV